MLLSTLTKRLAIFCLLLAVRFTLNAQVQPMPIPGDYRQNFVQGNYLIDENNWPMALLYFQEAYKVDSTNANINFKMGLCYLNSGAAKQQALIYLRRAAKDITRNYDPNEPRIKKAPQNTFYYLAEAYRYNYRFDSAITYFSTWKAILGGHDPDADKDIDNQINWCNNAIEFMASPLPVTITNLGDSVNSSYPDYSPVISVDENTLIFTSRRFGDRGIDGQYYEDIYISTKNLDGSWSAARPISPIINSATNDASISLSADGQYLFIYRDDNGGDIYISRDSSDGSWEAPVPMGGDIDSKYWETHACMSTDGNTLYFVSDRPGGFGGRDIYRCVKLPNGQWSKALNLGPSINTPYDEDSPFIHPDQKTLFFASKGHKSMGGFDIFFTAQDDSGHWADPTNVGYPINTPDDDVFYVTSLDGKRAYFASVRPDGYGEKDIYMATLAQPKTQPLALLVGRVYNADGSPLKQIVEIDVTNTNTGDMIGQYHPRTVDGKFTVILPPGNTYQISYLVDGKEYSNEVIDIPAGTDFDQIDRAINLRDLVLGKLPMDVDTTGKHHPVDSTHIVKNTLPKDWKAQLTQTHNLSFSMFFKYNVSEIDPADGDFKTFIDSCASHVVKNGEINFRITSGASQVPTHKFKTNKDLAADRAQKAQNAVNKALQGKGVDMAKVHWVVVDAHVLGPQYHNDFMKNRETYERYQFVKIRGY